MKTVIFDLDGTLADTSADLIAAANACFDSLGHGPLLDPVKDASTAFRGGRAMLRLGFERLGQTDTDAFVDQQYHPFLGFYRDHIDIHTTLYPGVTDALDRLKAQDHRLGICTNKPEGLAVTLVERLGISGFFGSLVGADTLPVRKPNPEPFQKCVRDSGGSLGGSVLIGDTDTDRKTARNAGVPCILVTFGPDGDGVAQYAPEALLDGYDRLEEALQAVF